MAVPLKMPRSGENAESASPRPARFSPVVLRLAEEHNISLAELKSIEGKGLEGRVRKRDLLRYLESRPAPASPKPQPASSPGSVPPDAEAESQPIDPSQTLALTPMRAAIAEHMVRSVRTSPHVTSVFELDMSRVTAYRQTHRSEFARQGISLGYSAFFVQAAVEALRAYPLANATFGEGEIVLHPHINIGLAVAVEGGLLVPVIKRAEELSLKGLAQAVDELARQARSGKLAPDDVRGGTFTVTNPGMQGALFGTAILHQPQAAILGVGAIVKRPVVTVDEAIAVRSMVYVSLTYDHRVMDGFGANSVLTTIKEFLESYPD